MSRQRLQNAVDKLPVVPGAVLLELIRASNRLYNVSWDDIVTMVEKKSGDDLSSSRSKKCSCGSSLYANGKCDSYTCQNSQWLRKRVVVDKDDIRAYLIVLGYLPNDNVSNIYGCLVRLTEQLEASDNEEDKRILELIRYREKLNGFQSIDNPQLINATAQCAIALSEYLYNR